MGASPLSGSAILKANFGLQVIRTTSSLPGTGDLSIFTVATGRVILTSLVGQVTTAIQAQANAIKIKSVPTTGTAKDLSGTLDVNGFEVGALISLDGTALTTTLSGTNAGGALITRTGGILVPVGAIKLNTAATNTGAIQWTCTYIPYDTGASVAAA